MKEITRNFDKNEVGSRKREVSIAREHKRLMELY